MKNYAIEREKWSEFLKRIAKKENIYAPFMRENSIEYLHVNADNADSIKYHIAKPTSSVKIFFFPIKENVVKNALEKRQIIIGVPACDLASLNLMDKIFLDEDFLDPYYKKRRDETILIGNDCYSITDSCHCTIYDIDPYPTKNYDINLSSDEDKIYLTVNSEKGEKFINSIKSDAFKEVDDLPELVNEKRAKTAEDVKKQNKELPGLESTRKLVLGDHEKVWKKFAKTCVSCGACSAICPTCHCFLLIDKENFEKIKNWDTCQYPSFERVAAGEDPLRRLYERLKNRYLCKFVHKPDMFGEIACTGCGRCIDACIGEINKNELIIELSNC